MTTKFSCEFCKREFVKESSLISHSCEKKRRWFQKDEPHARLAFMAWKRFYELSNVSQKKNSNNYIDFINSQFYLGFTRFGRHVRDLNALVPAKFIDYVIKNNIHIDNWTHDAVYEQYVRELTKKESPEEALERNILLMSEWSMQSDEPWYDFFRKVSCNQAVAWLKNGRISPWILYNVDSAEDFFTRCNAEHIAMINKYAPTGLWKLKFNKNKDSCDWIRTTLRENGM